jgi:hypothetical protein
MAGSLTLLPGEEIYLESAKVPLQITNFRVCQRTTIFTNPQLESITLEAIASVGLRTVSWPWLIVLAGILLLLALLLTQLPYGTGNIIAGGSLFGAVLLVVLYFATRERNLYVESMGGSRMWVACKALSLEECCYMINAIHRAKLEFLRRLPGES